MTAAPPSFLTAHGRFYLVLLCSQPDTCLLYTSIVSEVLKSMFSPQSGDYVTAVDESSLILIKSVENTTTPQALHELAETIVAMMNAEALLDVKVAYGTVVQELKDVSKSYKEAKMALDVGKIFYACLLYTSSWEPSEMLLL